MGRLVGGAGRRAPWLRPRAMLVLGVALAGALVVAAVWAALAAVVDNGDFTRLARPAGLATTPWEPNAAGFEILDESGGWPVSSHGVLVWLAAALFRLAGAEILPLWALYAMVAGPFLAGCIALVALRPDRSGAAVAGIALAGFLAFGRYVPTLFEAPVLIAAAPWLVAFLHWKGPAAPFAFMATAVVVLTAKATMILFLPLLALGWLRLSDERSMGARAVAGGLGVLLVAAALKTVSPSLIGTSDPNAYNRYYNGIGLALQDVASWPGDEWPERRAHFRENRETLQARSAPWEPFDTISLHGTDYFAHYWPMKPPRGVAPAAHEVAPGVTAADVLEVGGLGGFAAFFLRHPEVVPLWLAQCWQTFLGADYTVRYTARDRTQGSAAVSATVALAEGLRANAGLLWLVIGLGAAARGRSALVALTVVGAPLIVVAGDGYYEFERHLYPLFFLLPALVGHAESVRNRPGGLAAVGIRALRRARGHGRQAG